MRGCLQKAKLSDATMKTFKKNEFRWHLILSLGKGADGKWKQRWVTFHGTQKAAEQRLRELTVEVHKGDFIDPSKLTTGQWLEEWLGKIKSTRGPRTYEAYRNAIQTHLLKSSLASVPLQRLTPSDVEHYHQTKSTTLSTATLRIHPQC